VLHNLIGLEIFGILIGRRRYILPIYGLTLLVGTLWIFRSQWCKKNAERITYILNVFGFGLILSSSIAAIMNFDWSKFTGKRYSELTKAEKISNESKPVSKTNNSKPKPNVYFIIFDSYPSNSALKKYYGWDDSGLINALRSLGFTVNENARSNYPSTNLSVPSILNMQYIHEDKEFIKAKDRELYLDNKYKFSAVIERFKSEGYEVIFNGVPDFTSTDFTNLFLGVSLGAVYSEIFFTKHKDDTINRLNFLKQMEKPQKPTFVYFHILCPHSPYIFKPDGSTVTYLEYLLRLAKFSFNPSTFDRAYLDQVKFIGTQIIQIASQLRAKDPDAIIIIMADHGLLLPHSAKYKKSIKIDSSLGILYAIYTPPGIVIPEKITPVNLFRYLFNNLFDDKLEILPDRFFTIEGRKRNYNFSEVTQGLKLIDRVSPY
jgi:glucan phosphoethanolaminetransferase (alkaline phosphatase superfamily)